MKHLSSVILSLLFVISISANDIQTDKKLIAFQSSIAAEKIGNYQLAIEELNKIYNDFNDDYLVNLRMGWLNYLIENYDKSITYYNKSIKICDNCIESMLGLTYPLSALNKWDDIEDIYDRILDIDENNYTATLNLGKIKYNSSDYLNSKIYFEKIYNNFPSDIEANVYLGWIYYNLGNSSKARDYFLDAVINDPDNKSALEGLKLTK